MTRVEKQILRGEPLYQAAGSSLESLSKSWQMKL